MALLNISVMTKDHKVQNAIFEINEVAAESLLSAIAAAPNVVPMESMGRIAQGIVAISDARLSNMEEVEAAFRAVPPVVGNSDGAKGVDPAADPSSGVEVAGGVDGTTGGGDPAPTGNGEGGAGNPESGGSDGAGVGGSDGAGPGENPQPDTGTSAAPGEGVTDPAVPAVPTAVPADPVTTPENTPKE